VRDERLSIDFQQATSESSRSPAATASPVPPQVSPPASILFPLRSTAHSASLRYPSSSFRNAPQPKSPPKSNPSPHFPQSSAAASLPAPGSSALCTEAEIRRQPRQRFSHRARHSCRAKFIQLINRPVAQYRGSVSSCAPNARPSTPQTSANRPSPARRGSPRQAAW